jgi:preprotein translocase subunit SecE
MNVKVDNSAPSSALDIARYAIAILVIAAGIAGYYWFAADWPSALRGLVPVVGIVAAAAIFAFTSKGRSTLEYLSEARFELRKVIWPTRQETIRSTIVILIVVVLMSLLLGLIDFIIGGGIKLLLGT